MSADLDTFLMILDQIDPGTRLSVDNIRTELEAAEIPKTSYGPLFRAACERGELRATNTAHRCRPSSRRGGRALVYVRTTPKGKAA